MNLNDESIKIAGKTYIIIFINYNLEELYFVYSNNSVIGFEFHQLYNNLKYKENIDVGLTKF